MFLLGLLSVFQMAFVPGYILICLLKLDIKRASQTVIYSFGLSLLVNYLLVYLLTTFNFYKTNVIYTLLAIEYLYLGYLVFRDTRRTQVLKIINLPKAVYYILKSESWINRLIMGLTIYVIYGYLKTFISSLGQVFLTWDALWSWNRWAIDWFNNRLPALTWHYPQLIPANWSLTYMMIGNTDVQMFARAVMPLFLLATLLIFLDLAIGKKQGIDNSSTRAVSINFTYLIGLVIYGVLVKDLYRFYAPGWLTDGYVDTAVTFFAFLTFYCLLQLNETSVIDIKSLLLSVIFGSAAAVTKQSGFFFLFAALVYCAWYLFKNKGRFSLSNKYLAGVSLLAGLIIFTIVLSWYIPKQIQISKGLDQSEIPQVTNHGGKTFRERAIAGVSLFPETLVIVVALLLFLSLFDSRARWVSLGLALPYMALWALFFSYDIRNFFPAIPFIAYSTAFSVAFFFRLVRISARISDKKLEIRFHRQGGAELNEGTPLPQAEKLYFSLGKAKLAYGLVALLLAIAALSFTKYNSRVLLAQQINLQKQLSDSALNSELYKYESEHHINGAILTDYGFFPFLPEFRKNKAIHHIFGDTASLAIFKDANISYFLLSGNVNPSLRAEIDAGLASGLYELIFNFNGYRFLKVRT